MPFVVSVSLNSLPVSCSRLRAYSADFLHRAGVHERLTAEEVDLAVLPWAASVDDEVHRRASDLRAHDRPMPP